MTMKVATRSSGTLGGRQRSRKLGNSGNRVATTTLLEAQGVGGIYDNDSSTQIQTNQTPIQTR